MDKVLSLAINYERIIIVCTYMQASYSSSSEDTHGDQPGGISWA